MNDINIDPRHREILRTKNVMLVLALIACTVCFASTMLLPLGPLRVGLCLVSAFTWVVSTSVMVVLLIRALRG